ncbi:MAG: phage baseplate protein [Lachnospiraceae bacterium]|nr:phage baseplate protein [Lachnospiraceae bacterium]
MRQFKLYNSLGQVYNLNDMASFFHDPKGLGFDDDGKYERIGNQYIATQEGIKQAEPEGKIRFLDYVEFNNFAKFIQCQPLKLQYSAADTYYMDVIVKKIEKTEIENIGLDVSIKFSALGQWYKDIIKSISNEALVGKVYPYEYPYTYADDTQGSVEIESDSGEESPVKITIMGPCVNPNWTHYVNGNVVETGKMNCTVPEGKRLEISSILPYSIRELDAFNNVVADRYQKSDFSTERFVKLQHGINIISITHEGTEPLRAVVEGMIYYATI